MQKNKQTMQFFYSFIAYKHVFQLLYNINEVLIFKPSSSLLSLYCYKFQLKSSDLLQFNPHYTTSLIFMHNEYSLLNASCEWMKENEAMNFFQL